MYHIKWGLICHSNLDLAPLSYELSLQTLPALEKNLFQVIEKFVSYGRRFNFDFLHNGQLLDTGTCLAAIRTKT